ncbi:MAG: glycoside hydrolase family 3 N-terminal domain-containing protein [Eubacteriales bacterium]
MDAMMKGLIGQCLTGGLVGTIVDEEFTRLVKEYKIGNVILFRHNIESVEQVTKLCKAIQELIVAETGNPAFITIDQEGGVVTRLTDDACNVPGAMAVAATGNTEHAQTLARITARELKAIGVNFNLTPSVDVNNNKDNPVIGVRSYGDQPEKVASYACATLKGYEEEGMLCCVKHFPGHGDTAVDSHLGLPSIDKSMEELEQMEFLPFKRAIEKGVPSVMASHILFPQIEKDHIPCTMSKVLVTDILKNRMGFKGLVISDCLEMDAIQKFYGTPNGVVEGMKAGIDLLFVSHSLILLEESVKAMYQAVESGDVSEERIREAAGMIKLYKDKYCSIGSVKNDTSANKKISNQIRKETFVLTQGSLFELGTNPFFVGPEDYRATQASSQETTSVTFPEYMAKELGGIGLVTTKDPDATELEKAVQMAKESTSIVIGTYNGHLLEGQMNLIKKLSKVSNQVVVVALRNPYDLIGLEKHVTGIAAWDYTTMTLELLATMFKEQETLTGVMPVTI